MIGFDITRPANNITVRIYTTAYRKVLEKQVPGNYFRQGTVTLDSWVLGSMANGIYYAVLYAENGAEKAISKPEELIILR